MQNCGENGAAERMCRRKLAGLSEPKWRFSSPLWGGLIWWRASIKGISEDFPGAYSGQGRSWELKTKVKYGFQPKVGRT